MQNTSPRLIILEGPPGAGKTALQKFLQIKLKSKGLCIDILPEFSHDKIGQLIENNCQYGQKQPKWLTGVGGLWVFLADKINQIETAINDGKKIWICDRFILSQYNLGLRMIGEKEDKIFAHKIIQQVSLWAFKKISKHSLIIFLDASINILQMRLEKRIDRKLTRQELKYLDNEIRHYCKLANSLKSKNTFIVHTNDSINIAGDKVLKLVYSKWHL